ncbi:hypothetical protein JCM11251_005389 [Rhodosporidiobolus azoricus]
MSANNTTTTSTTTGSRNAGEEIGERTGGIFGAIHGAGEAIRGTINSGLDGLGDGIAQRPQGTATSRTSAAGEESVAEKGKREFQDGVAALKGQSTTQGTTTHTSNSAL